MEPTIGGTRRHLKDIVYSLDRNIFEVSVICSTLRNPAFLADIAAFKQNGINKVFVVQMKREISPFSDLFAFIRIYNLLNKKGYHIVHTHSSKAGFLGRLASKLAGVPIILYTPHSFSFQGKNASFINQFYIKLERFAAGFTDRIVAVSCDEKRVALKAGICQNRMVEVIENGVNMQAFKSEANIRKLRREFGIRDGRQVVGTVARFCPQKGYKYLIKAARQVVNICPQAIFLLIGDGELWDKIKAMVGRWNLSENVIMTGQRKDISDLYALMDLFVLPSLWEGTPYALLEAMAAKRPVIATAVSGTVDIVRQGKTGILVPPEDPKALSLAIVQLLKDKKLAEKLGIGGRRLVEEKYQLKDQIRKLESFYLRIVEEKIKFLPHREHRGHSEDKNL